jgi:hypothetical protein
MANSNLITIGETAHRLDIAQDVAGDFRWAIEFLQEGTDTPLDVSDDDFLMEVYDTDGTTVIMTGTQSFLSDSIVQFDIPSGDYEGTTGCRYDYKVLQTTASGFKKVLFRGKFTLTK